MLVMRPVPAMAVVGRALVVGHRLVRVSSRCAQLLLRVLIGMVCVRSAMLLFSGMCGLRGGMVRVCGH